MRAGLFPAYWRAQRSRARKLTPRLLALTLLLALCGVLAAYLLAARSAGDTAKQKVRIGVVSQDDDPMIHAGLTAVTTLDDTRFSLALIELAAEAEAAEALAAGRLDAYVCIPQGFIDGMQLGLHVPVRFVSGENGASLGGRLTEEIVSLVGSLALESENAIYGAQQYVAEHLPALDPYDTGDTLARRYLWTVLDRRALFSLETLGVGGLSFAGYYLCGLSVAFLLLSGLNAGPLATRRSAELGRMLKAAGLRAPGQILAEYLPFSGLALLAALCAGVLAAALAARLGLRVSELRGMSGGELLRLALLALPVVLMLAAMQLFLYELSPNAVGALLLQFLNAAAQSYAAGCFYPASFFPDALRRVGAALPAGLGMRTLTALLAGTEARPLLLACLGCGLLFLVLTAALRALRLRS